MHVHIQFGKGEAKFWIEPKVELASSRGFSVPEVLGFTGWSRNGEMRSDKLGSGTLQPEVADISDEGFWI